MKRQLVHLSAKKEFVRKSLGCHCVEEDGKAPISYKISMQMWKNLQLEVQRKASISQGQAKAV